MPTGYTATLMEKGQTFQEFIMGCARAFGALIVMRDSPLEAPIPEKLEPSDYHAKRLVESCLELSRLKEMTDAEKEVFGLAEKTASIQRNKQWFEKEQAENKRLEDMAAQVKAWTPPTDDHVELKKFMLQQIEISKNKLDYIQTSLDEAANNPPMAYYVAAVSEAARDIKCHTEENAKEIERTADRTKWIRQLRESI